MFKFIAVSSLAAAAAFSSAALANFDSLAEGDAGSTLTTVGITFSNLDRNLGSGFEHFAIDDSTSDLTGFAGYSSPNVLGFGGWSPGPGTSFSRFGSMNFTAGTTASGASMDVFSFGSDAGTTLTLQGLNGATVVNSATISLPTAFVISHDVLTLGSGTYTSFRLLASSPTNQNSAFFSVDNVNVVTSVPEPASVSLLLLGTAALLRRRKGS